MTLSLPHPQSRHMPSFSLVLAQVLPLQESARVLALSDARRSPRRAFRVAFQPRDDDPLMKTVDTRFSASSLYDIEYATKNKKSHTMATVHVHEVTGSSSCSSSVSSTDDDDDEYDTASMASTTELDLNREFEAEFGLDTDTDAETVFEGEVEDDGAAPPLHGQLAALAALAQVPSSPPLRYLGVEEWRKHSISRRDFGPSAISPTRSRGRSGSKDGAPPRSGRFAKFNSLPGTLKASSSLWRGVKKAGSVLLRPVKKKRSAPPSSSAGSLGSNSRF